jgi:diphthamide biosynthesis protein 2
MCGLSSRTHCSLMLVQYLPVIRRLRQIISRSQKKSYTISVGKLNPAKLANFMEIECFVLVACPENSIIDTKVRYLVIRFASVRLTPYQEFLRPIITPHELIAALSPEIEWSSSYTLDFDDVLAIEAQSRPGMIFSRSAGGPLTLLMPIEKSAHSDDVDDDDQPSFSFVTGTYRGVKRFGGHGEIYLRPFCLTYS